jgi:hypothetical protein
MKEYEDSIYYEAYRMLDRWRDWSEHHNLTIEEFVKLVGDSDELQEKLWAKSKDFD